MWRRLLVGFVVAAFILFLLARKVDSAAVAAALRGADWSVLLVALLLAFVNMWIKGERWAVALAASAGPRPRRRMFSAMVIGTAGNLLLPARLGDFAKVLVLRRHNDLTMTRALAASWSVQIFDFLAVTMILVVSSTAVASPRVLYAVLASGVLLLAGLPLAYRYPVWSDWIARGLIPKRFQPRAQEILRNSRQGLAFLDQGRTVAQVLLLTAAVWICDALSMYASLRAFHMPLGLGAAALVIAATGLTFVLPLTPGNVGIYQAVCVLVLGAYGIDRSRAFAFGIGVQGLALVAIVLCGLALLQREGLHLMELTAESARSEHFETNDAGRSDRATPPRGD